MTNNDVSHDEQDLRAALARYRQRFEPSQPEWSAIEARRAASESRRRAPRPGRSLCWKITPIAVLAATIAAVSLLPISIDIGSSRAQAARTGPAPPQYHPVVVAPTFPPGSTMAAIRARGFIRVGVKDDQPAFGFRDHVTGAWSGFDVEIAKLMAAGIFGGDAGTTAGKIVWIPVVSKDREAYLQAGKVDIVVATYSINDARKQVVDFAGPYFQARQDIMVKAGDSSIAGVADLNDRRVCTVKGSTSYQNLLSHAPLAQVTLLDSYSACARALADGRVAAVTTDGAILAGLVHQYGFAFQTVNNPFSDEFYGIGLKKGDLTFRSFLNDRLRTIKADEDWSLASSYALQNIRTFGPPPIEG